SARRNRRGPGGTRSGAGARSARPGPWWRPPGRDASASRLRRPPRVRWPPWLRSKTPRIRPKTARPRVFRQPVPPLSLLLSAALRRRARRLLVVLPELRGLLPKRGQLSGGVGARAGDLVEPAGALARRPRRLGRGRNARAASSDRLVRPRVFFLDLA